MIRRYKKTILFIITVFLVANSFSAFAETSEYDFESAEWICTCDPYSVTDGKWQWNNLASTCNNGATVCVQNDVVYQGNKAAIHKHPAGTVSMGYIVYDESGIYQKYWFRSYFYIKDDPNISGEHVPSQKFNFSNTVNSTDFDGNSFNYQIGTSLGKYSDESSYYIQVGSNKDSPRGLSFYATPGTQQVTNVRMYKNGSSIYLDFANASGGMPDWVKIDNRINIIGSKTDPYNNDKGDKIISINGTKVGMQQGWAWTDGTDDIVTVVYVPPIEANKWHYYEFYKELYWDETEQRYMSKLRMWLDNDQYFTEKIFKMGKAAFGITNIKLFLNSSNYISEQDSYIYTDTFRFSTDSFGGTVAGNQGQPSQIKYTLSDFANLYQKWHTSDSTYDLNSDGIVNSKDLGMMMRNFEL